jgi:hypothetical protein
MQIRLRHSRALYPAILLGHPSDVPAGKRLRWKSSVAGQSHASTVVDGD